MHSLVLAVLSLLNLLVLEVGNRKDVLKEVVKQDQGVELQIRVLPICSLKGFANALNDKLSYVKTIMADQVDLHELCIDASLRLASILKTTSVATWPLRTWR